MAINALALVLSLTVPIESAPATPSPKSEIVHQSNGAIVKQWGGQRAFQLAQSGSGGNPTTPPGDGKP